MSGHERASDRQAAYGPLVFSTSEYVSRVDRAVRLLGEAGLDALLLTDDRNLLYFAGWGELAPGGARARPRFLVLDRWGNAALLVHTASSAPAGAMTWLQNVRTYEPLGGAPIEDLRRWLADQRLAAGRLGMELGLDQRLDLTVADFQALGRALPGAELVDAASLLWRLRMIKSAAEIDRIRQACAITTRSYDRFFAEARVGMSESELTGLFNYGASAEGASASSCYVLVGRGRYERGNAVPTTNPSRMGDMLWVDGGANVGGYRADFSRAGVFGPPDPDQSRLAEVMLAVVARTISMIEPGVTARDLARRCTEEMARYGLEPNTGAGRHGHGLGLLVTEPPDIAAHDHTVLEPGMVITIEPGYVAEHGRYHFEDDVLVTATGHEILSACSRSLRVL